MFELDIDMLKEQGIQLFDTAKRPPRTLLIRAKTSSSC